MELIAVAIAKEKGTRSLEILRTMCGQLGALLWKQHTLQLVPTLRRLVQLEPQYVYSVSCKIVI